MIKLGRLLLATIPATTLIPAVAVIDLIQTRSPNATFTNAKLNVEELIDFVKNGRSEDDIERARRNRANLKQLFRRA
jgi:hypothetical protein